MGIRRSELATIFGLIAVALCLGCNGGPPPPPDDPPSPPTDPSGQSWAGAVELFIGELERWSGEFRSMAGDPGEAAADRLEQLAAMAGGLLDRATEEYPGLQNDLEYFRGKDRAFLMAVSAELRKKRVADICTEIDLFAERARRKLSMEAARSGVTGAWRVATAAIDGISSGALSSSIPASPGRPGFPFRAHRTYG